MKKNYDVIGIVFIALLFGFSFPLQSLGAKYVAPFSFNVIKYIIAIVTMLPFCLRKTNTSLKDEIKYGVIIGTLIFVFSYLQQVVAVYLPAGKVGFITTMYIIEVPLINYFVFKKRIKLQTALSIVISLFGLVLLCDVRDFNFSIYDILTIVCSLTLAVQIIVLGKYCTNCDPFKLNMFNFIFILIASLIGAIVTKETLNFEGYKLALIPMIYNGLGCSTIGETLQTHCQKTVDATTVSLIMSTESIFSLIGGYLILHETLTTREFIGCVIMFVGVILCITDTRKKKKKES